MTAEPATIAARGIVRMALCALIALPGGPRAGDTAPAASRLPWSAEPTTHVTVEKRSFSSGSLTLAGTLYMPRKRKPIAAMVVTHSASSPLRTASLYEHLRKVLPPLGIAVFVYDRRGSGQSGDEDAGGDFTRLADDAVAAVRSLQSDPRIDPRRIGIWGLSQGGWIGPLAASRSDAVAFVVSVSAPVVTADVQMLFSSTNHLRANGYSQADIDQMQATRKAVDDYMRGHGTREAAQKRIDAARTRPWFKYTYMGQTVRDRAVSGWRREIENDPLRNLLAVDVPILVLYGADDAVVPVARSIERLEANATRLPNLWVHVVGHADHAMQASADLKTSLDPERDGTEQPDAPEYFAVVASWLSAQGMVQY